MSKFAFFLKLKRSLRPFFDLFMIFYGIFQLLIFQYFESSKVKYSYLERIGYPVILPWAIFLPFFILFQITSSNKFLVWYVKKILKKKNFNFRQFVNYIEWIKRENDIIKYYDELKNKILIYISRSHTLTDHKINARILKEIIIKNHHKYKVSILIDLLIKIYENEIKK